MHTLIWLFPIIFMLHDFEEIIMMKPWLIRNQSDFQERFPRLAGRVLSYYQQVSTSAFAFGVACLFLTLSTVTFISVQTGSYQLWFGLFMGFFLHLFIHIGQWLIFKKIRPGNYHQYLGFTLLYIHVKSYYQT